ncbi:MAG: glycosyltransferase [Bacteroidia bacterium]|nr:glycosyltransferase [Bacteroidia bacterium]
MNIEQECITRFKNEKEYLGNSKPVNQIIPLVSVSVTTYQHRNYIKDCLEGILMQQTNFPIEIIVGEDESTDGTRAICIEYAEKHQDKIRLYLRDRTNSHYYDEEGILICRFNAKWNRLAARGKYIAICEGDDYWIDPLKLQKQAEFMDSNPSFAICHHNMQVIYEIPGNKTRLSNSPKQKEVTSIYDLAKGNYIYSASCLFRNGLIKTFPEWFYSAPIGDYTLHMLNAQYGLIRYIPEVMGVYRVHKDGMWEHHDYVFRLEIWVELLELMKRHFAPDINRALNKAQIITLLRLMLSNKETSEKIKNTQYGFLNVIRTIFSSDRSLKKRKNNSAKNSN